MKISLIFASSVNSVIGVDNKLPWQSSSDLKHFYSLTVNNTVIMGRKTFESLDNKPLSKRFNIVISSTIEESIDHCRSLYFVNNLQAAIELAKTFDKEIFIIGGSSILKEGLKYCNKIYYTLIEKNIELKSTCVFNPFLIEYKDNYFYFDENNKFKIQEEKVFKDAEVNGIFFNLVKII